MNVMIGYYATACGENWPIYVDAEREAFYARCIERVSTGASSTAGSLCEPPGGPSPFEPDCPLSAFLSAAPTYMVEAVLQRREALGTVPQASEPPRRDGPIFEDIPAAQNTSSFREKTTATDKRTQRPPRPARDMTRMF